LQTGEKKGEKGGKEKVVDGRGVRAHTHTHIQRSRSTPPVSFESRSTLPPPTTLEWRDGVGLVDVEAYDKLHTVTPPNWPPPPLPPQTVTKRSMLTSKQQRFRRTGSQMVHSNDKRHYAYFIGRASGNDACAQRFPSRPLGGDWSLVEQVDSACVCFYSPPLFSPVFFWILLSSGSDVCAQRFPLRFLGGDWSLVEQVDFFFGILRFSVDDVCVTFLLPSSLRGGW